MKRILAVSLIALGLAGCTPREQQLVAAGAVGALAGAVVANGVSDSYDRTHYRPRPYYAPQPYYAPRPAYNPYVYHAPRRPHCYIVDRRTPYGIRQERICN